MKTNKLLEKPKKDLMKELQDKRSELRSLRFNLVVGRLKNVTEIKKIKRHIARILTVVNQSSNKEK